MLIRCLSIGKHIAVNAVIGERVTEVPAAVSLADPLP
jgi:hypothetical protein